MIQLGLLEEWYFASYNLTRVADHTATAAGGWYFFPQYPTRIAGMVVFFLSDHPTRVAGRFYLYLNIQLKLPDWWYYCF
jgi:hypothetical protein